MASEFAGNFFFSFSPLASAIRAGVPLLPPVNSPSLACAAACATSLSAVKPAPPTSTRLPLSSRRGHVGSLDGIIHDSPTCFFFSSVPHALYPVHLVVGLLLWLPLDDAPETNPEPGPHRHRFLAHPAADALHAYSFTNNHPRRHTHTTPCASRHPSSPPGESLAVADASTTRHIPDTSLALRFVLTFAGLRPVT